MQAIRTALALALILARVSGSSSLRWSRLRVGKGDGGSLLSSTSYVLSEGNVLGILGPSGSGKSTFLTAIAGILPRTLMASGEVAILDGDRHEVDASSALSIGDIAYLSQDDSFFSQLTVEETLLVEERLQYHDER